MRLELNFPPIDNNYNSGELKPSWFSRCFPSLGFYTRMYGVVNKAANLAKKGAYDDAAWSTSSYDILKALEAVGVTVDVRNLSAVTNLEEPCVVVGNHMSTLETFVMPYLISPHKPVTFIVKKSLVEYPVFKHVMRSRDPIVVGRENPREDLKNMLTEGVKRLQSGISLIVFPQTTRTPVFDPSQFNSIGVKIAKKAGRKVVPVALKTDAWGNGKLLKDFGKINPKRTVRFSFGEPMEITGNGSDQQQSIVDFIQGKMDEWKT